jgi:hypothetical protein
VEKTSPMQRVFGADSVTARRTGADLAETSLLTKENLEGGVTTAGPAVDREARLMIHQGQVAVGDELSKLYSEYRFGDQVTAPRAQGMVRDMLGQNPEGKLSYDQFKEQVSDAMRNGDTHETQQVQGPRSRSGRRFSSRGRSARSRPGCCRRASTSRRPTAISRASTTSRRSRRSGRSSSTGSPTGSPATSRQRPRRRPRSASTRARWNRTAARSTSCRRGSRSWRPTPT